MPIQPDQRSRLINPTLCTLLERQFGRVRVNNPGTPMQCRYQRDYRTDRLRLKVDYSGEEFYVCCPFCRDQRYRLSINHRWAVHDPKVKHDNLGLANCFNEQCLTDLELQRRLRELVFRLGPRRIKINTNPNAGMPTQATEVSPPGDTITLTDLHRRDPDHPAIRYLLDREFDLLILEKHYGVCYCVDSKYNLAKNRIIIPIIMGGKRVGWQARYPGDLPDSKVPKYWSAPGMMRSLVAYNYDAALRHDTIVVVEGPTDVWRGGPAFMGLLGKTMSPSLLGRFRRDITAKYGGRPHDLRARLVIVVLLDPKQDANEKAKGRTHHIARLTQQLSSQFPTTDRRYIMPLNLAEMPGYTEDDDPGDIPRTDLVRFIRRAGKIHGVPAFASFDKTLTTPTGVS